MKTILLSLAGIIFILGIFVLIKISHFNKATEELWEQIKKDLNKIFEEKKMKGDD